jgi:hypothetical protein
MRDIREMKEWIGQARAYLKPSLGPDVDIDIHLDHDSSPVLRDFNNGLLVAYAVDQGDHYSLVQNRHLVGTGVSDDDLHRIGISNLYDLASEKLRTQSYRSVTAVLLDGNFEASVLLLDTVWENSLADQVRSDFLVAVPSRVVLVFGDTAFPTTVQDLHSVIERVYKPSGDHLISDRLYRRRNGNWVRHDA